MRYLLATLALLAALALPSGASAEAGPTTAQALAAADAFYGPHECAGKVRVLTDPAEPAVAALVARGSTGEATGLTATWDGAAWAWHVARCEIAVFPTADPWTRCNVIMHEVGHLVYERADHDWMPPIIRNNRTPACAPTVAPEVDDAEPTLRQALISDIRDDLPRGVAWRVACSPNGARMRCRASSRRAKYDRIYAASIVADAMDMRLDRLIRRR